MFSNTLLLAGLSINLVAPVGVLALDPFGEEDLDSLVLGGEGGSV